MYNKNTWAEKYAMKCSLSFNSEHLDKFSLSVKLWKHRYLQYTYVSVHTRECLCVCECVQANAQVCYAFPERRNDISIEMFVLLWFCVGFCFSFVVFALNYVQEFAQKPQKGTTADLCTC